MKYLLDVNVLLAAIWTNHSRHSETFSWLKEKSLVVSPLSELGFLRIGELLLANLGSALDCDS